ncbi:MAG: hypothetical protein LUD27_02125 [Clostridia bacterium]|nr:hypothetical protein [Clostridia bacterium]
MIAVIDISSTSLSMTVLEDETYKPVYKFREGLSTISYIEDGKVSEHGIEKIADRIAIFQDQCIKLGVEKLYVLSTAAMRFISNADEVFTIIRERTGANIIQLDGETEAYCDCAANQSFKDMSAPIVVDIGGASIELCDLTKEGRKGIKCLEFGALTLKHKFVKSVYPNKEECAKIKKYLKKAFGKLDFHGKADKNADCTAVLVGATNRSIYEIYRDYYDIPESEDMTIDTDKLNKLAKKLVEAPDRSHLLIKNAPEKIYFIVVAILTLVQILKTIPFKTVVVSDSGVKEGFLRLVSAGEIKAELSALKPEKSEKEISSVEELAEHIKNRQKAAKKGKKSSSESSEKPQQTKQGKGKSHKDSTTEKID